MSGTPTGIGNYPPGVTDNDPHFDGREERDDEEPPELDPLETMESPLNAELYEKLMSKEYDGAPFCQYCGAKRERDCQCVIAENH